ncbi:MAG: hypothetical protein WDN04_25405 [Rhodospirillales bacterium]
MRRRCLMLSCLALPVMVPAAGYAETVSSRPAVTVTPLACATGGVLLWTNLEACGWPGPANTGPVLSQCPGGVLTINSGAPTRQITISTPGTVISCEIITGGLQIAAQNVTIKNSIIAYDGGGKGGSGVISINDGANATIDHVEINGLNHTHACIWDEGVKGAPLAHSMVAENVNCYGVDDGIFSWWWASDTNAGAGGDFVIKGSYFHDFTENAANGHIDGYQTEGARGGNITHNTFKIARVPGDVNVAGGGIDSAIAIWNDYNQPAPTGLVAGNVKVTNNLIAGGGFAIYAEDYSPGDGGPGDPSAVGGNRLVKVTFTDNKFSTYLNGCVGLWGVWFYRAAWPPYFGGPTDGWHRSGNVVLETGLDVDSGNPPGCT